MLVGKARERAVTTRIRRERITIPGFIVAGVVGWMAMSAVDAPWWVRAVAIVVFIATLFVSVLALIRRAAVEAMTEVARDS